MKKDFRQTLTRRVESYVSFVDFIVQYHRIPHHNLRYVNQVQFTVKKRSLLHQVCQNVHIHLLKNLLNYDALVKDVDESQM